MTIGNKSTAIWPKLHDEQCIGYDAKGCYNHFLSDNPDFNGFEGKGYDTNFAHDVSYVFNEYGHRSLNDLPGVPVRYSEKHFLVVGGSQTFGIGVPIEKTYPHIISERLGMEYYNLSLPGASHDVNIFNLIWYLARRKPLFVLWEWLFDSRNALVLNNKDNTVLPLISMMVEKQEKAFDLPGLTDFFLSANDIGYNHTRRLMHKGILDNMKYKDNIVVHEYDFNKMDLKNKQIDVGRDGEHFGIETHKRMAELIYEAHLYRWG